MLLWFFICLSDSYLEWLLAVAFLGGIAAPLNYRWSYEEAKHAVEVVKPVMLVTDESCNYWSSMLQRDTIPSLRWHVFMDMPTSILCSSLNELTTETLKKPYLRALFVNYTWAPEGAAIICFTSGTTGKPKGVTISHSAVIVQSLAKIAVVGYSETDVYLHTAPLCHIGGISSAMAMLMVGGCHVLIPKFEAKSAFEAIEKHHITSLITVPAIMADLISVIRKKESRKEIASIEKILNGGGSLSLELIKDAGRFFPSAKLLSAYGMTETCSSLTFMTLLDPSTNSCTEVKSSSFLQNEGVCVGKPAPHVELKIYLDGSSHVGRILTRGPHLMRSYWGEVSLEKSESSQEGWFDTGDIGSIDNLGNVWLIGRTKGRIKSGGENVYPEEVEAVLSQHPGVYSSVVVGIPNDRLSEMLVACIQIRHHWQWMDDRTYDDFVNSREQILSSGILHRFCKEKNLTGFKIPKIFILWRKPFSVTTTGKLRRDQIQREVMSQLQLQFSLPSNM